MNTLTKIKEEIKEFLSYGNKFMNDIHRCLMVSFCSNSNNRLQLNFQNLCINSYCNLDILFQETADADIASTMNQYSEMEQKVHIQTLQSLI